MEEPKRKPGRPPKRKPPAPIPDTAQNVINALVKTRPKAQRKLLDKRAQDAET